MATAEQVLSGRVQVRVPPDLIRRLYERARVEDRPAARIVRQAIRDYLAESYFDGPHRPNQEG